MSGSSLDAPPKQPLPEETANLLTHGLGFLLSVAGTSVLLIFANRYGDRWQVLGCGVYGATLVSLYAASTLSHAFAHPPTRHFFRMLDQVCIFLLIAGTFTPFGLTFLRESWGVAIVPAMWLLALVGIFFKILFSRLHNVATGAYVVLGWMPVLAIHPILEHVPPMAFVWMLAGGLFYTAGTFFLSRDDRVPYFHAVWHLFVIAGSACHYLGVMLFVIPWQAS